MSVYVQQASSLMERLPERQQQFVVEFIKHLSLNSKAGESNLELLHQRQKEAVRIAIENLNAAETLGDDEIDGILSEGINLRSAEDLDL